MSRDNNLPFDRGQTWYGPDRTIDTANLGGENLEGQEKVVEDLDYTNTGTGAMPHRTARKITLRCVRNMSGVTLLGKRLALLNAAKTRITGLAATSGAEGYPIDEWLPSVGVRHGDLCWIVMEGPAMHLTPFADWGVDIAAGDRLQAYTANAGTTANASTAIVGRAHPFTVAAATTAGQFTDLINYVTNYIGTAMSARTTGQTNSDILVSVRRRP